MEPNAEVFSKAKEKAQVVYSAKREIWSPYFNQNIVLTSDGFHHLQFSAERERTKREQLLKFRLLPLGLEIIRKAGTLQEYRKGFAATGPRYARDGMIKMKPAEYWGFVAIIGEKKVKVRTVLRRVGDGNVTFWSVMFGSKMKDGNQKLFMEGIEDE